MEHRVKCLTCGKIFCYTDKDVKDSTINAVSGTFAAIGEIASTLSGNPVGFLVDDYLASKSINNIKDYNKCPFCGSTRLVNADRYEESADLEQTAAPHVAPAITIDAAASTESIMKRIRIFIEDEEWDNADRYCESLLDREPDNGSVYLLKYFAVNKIKSLRELKGKTSYDNLVKNKIYQKIKRYADDALSEELIRSEIDLLCAKNELSSLYTALEIINDHLEIEGFNQKKLILTKEIEKMEETKRQELEEQKKAEQKRRYDKALDDKKSDTYFSLRSAETEFQRLGDYLDSRRMAEECELRIKELDTLKAEEEKKRWKAIEEKEKKTKRAIVVAVATVAVLLVIIIISTLYKKVISPSRQYNAAIKMMASEDYQGAMEALKKVEAYKDAKDRISTCKLALSYKEALSLKAEGKFQEAIDIFSTLDSFMDSDEQINVCKYEKGIQLFENGDYEAAKDIFLSIEDYKDSSEQIIACDNARKKETYDEGIILFEKGDYEGAKEVFLSIEDYGDAKERLELCLERLAEETYASANRLKNEGKYRRAVELLTEIPEYKDSHELIEDCKRKFIYDSATNDILEFGFYQGETITWRVLDDENGILTLITEKAVDGKPYNETRASVNWSTCSLRRWLNDNWIDKAFNSEERALITLEGSPVSDKVYLLSVDEAEKYFSSNSDRICGCSPYATEQGIESKALPGRCTWWLRDDLQNDKLEDFVDVDGSILPNSWVDSGTEESHRPMIGVRPVVRIKVK